MRSFLRPFAGVHIAAVAFLGCLAIAWHTGETLWRWLSLSGAVTTALYAALLLRRERSLADDAHLSSRKEPGR